MRPLVIYVTFRHAESQQLTEEFTHNSLQAVKSVLDSGNYYLDHCLVNGVLFSDREFNKLCSALI
jgi:hypothetical protein